MSYRYFTSKIWLCLPSFYYKASYNFLFHIAYILKNPNIFNALKFFIFLASNLPYLIIEDEVINLIPKEKRSIKMKIFKLYNQRKYFISTCLGLLVCFTLFLSSCATRKEPLCGFVPNSTKLRLSWNNSLPVRLWLHPSVPYEYRQAFYTSVEIWEETFDGKDLFDIQELAEGSSTPPRRDNRSILYWDDEWNGSKDKTTEQAKTTIYWMGSQIIDSDIRFNAENYEYYTNEDLDRNEDIDNIFVKNKQHINTQASANNFNIITHLMAFIEQTGFSPNLATYASNILPSYTQLRSIYINGVEQKQNTYNIHLESLIIHEFGHALGLDHNQDSSSVMQERLSAQTERDLIGESDYDNIICEYGTDR